MIKIYGIKNCDKVKKALNFLSENEIDYKFFDYKKQILSPELIEEFTTKFTAEKIINKKGTTYRNLNDSLKEKLSKKEDLAEILCKNTSILKRPIILGKNIEIIGFDATEYAKKLK